MESNTAVAQGIREATRDAEARFGAANPRSAERFEQACRVLPGGNTRIITYYPPFPLTFARGDGAYLWDLDGHRHTDFVGDQSAAIYGHSHPVILDAIRRALDGGITLGGPSMHEADLATLICRRFPSIDLVRFCNSGTEANVLALATARAVTRRSKVMAFEGGFHGGVLSFVRGGGLLNVPFPTVLAPYNELEVAVAVLEREATDLAAVIVEPMMGGGGCIPGERAFLGALRDACTRHGVVLVFDEVMTSRLSPGGLQAAIGVTPDLTTLGKYVGGGLSFGAFGGRRDIMARFDQRRPDYLHHPGTFNNNVCTMAAGLAGLSRVFTAEAAIELNRRGDALRERLNRLGRERGMPLQATGVGSLMNLHFHAGPIRSPADAALGNIDLRNLLHLELLCRGFYLARRGFIALSLPLTDTDVDGLVAGLEDVLDGFAKLLAP
jgi:glutamate-1-semialdehyde 2,1-aminomutase